MKEQWEHGGPGDRGCEGRHKGRHHDGAKTFRRGRALEFLNVLEVKRATLKQQVESPEYQEIKPVLLGELKAVEMVIDEYTRHFELRRKEADEPQTPEGDS
ncbi:hypothetical protein [Paenibacillus typhae]|uniref:hypothetical protein n=1 Tax=Paenibacillus typhae TaxID=1174501 RepID=UPI001C8D5C8D|nr:hypothetical protein [Paenibacillus typhae]MBY0011802.1 hypothetical protein [Paenibacillus typhae]